MRNSNGSLVIAIKLNAKYRLYETIILLYVLQKTRRNGLLMFDAEGACKGLSCEETIGSTEDRFGDQQLAVGSRNQRKTRTQNDGESPPDFACAIEQLTHHVSLEDTRTTFGREQERKATTKLETKA
jgi:hypothetical protein